MNSLETDFQKPQGFLDKFTQSTVALLEWITGDKATFPTGNFHFSYSFPSLIHFSCFPKAVHPLLCCLSSLLPSCIIIPLFWQLLVAQKNPNTKAKKKYNCTFSLEAISQSMLCLLHRLRGLNNNLIFSPGRVSAASLSPLGMAQLLKAPQIPGEDYSRWGIILLLSQINHVKHHVWLSLYHHTWVRSCRHPLIMFVKQRTTK